jgi:hypothetical protein
MKDQTLEAIGKIITTPMNRDAVHFAVAPAIADTMLRPGQKVRIADFNGAGEPIVTTDFSPGEWDGIVDPFLTIPVMARQRFFLFLQPGSITSLRHEWTHPRFQ